MHPKLTASAVLCLFVPHAVRADGCKFAADGRAVPEREQRAMVEWADGVETLHVAALSDPAARGAVWVVPVRAAAADVRAEPVDAFPVVTYYETLRGRAERQLRSAVAAAAVLDSGGFCCWMVGGCGGKQAAGEAVEASRVERLGMVVVVVSAESRAGIERYLDAQGVDRLAADLSPLDPYFGQPGCSFVCGWVAGPDQRSGATGLRVVFPSPTLWFPLLPTRTNETPVGTVVYARGFVKPAPGCDLPGLRCEYVYGAVEERGVRQAFEADVRPRRDTPARLDPMTRVTLTSDPRKWYRDLELIPGTTTPGAVALAVTGWAGWLGPLWSALLGAALGLAIPRLAVPRAERRPVDRLAGALTGAAVVLTILASAVVFAAWRRWRFRDRPNQPRRYVVLPLLAVVHFAVVLGVCEGLIAWLAAGW